MKPSCLLIRAPGTNCDRELIHAFELAGAAASDVHIDALIADPAPLDAAQIIAFPGGFSYGDDVAAGRIFAHRLRQRLLEPLQNAVQRGTPVIGICNGFQVLVKCGLLPDPAHGGQSVTVSDNTTGRFIDRWVKFQANPDSPCIWTQGLTAMDLPIAHGEGRFTAPPQVVEQLESNQQVALRYAADDDPNGSVNHIAGICDPTGLVFGLMPHPERCVHLTHHPAWTRFSAQQRQAEPAGLTMIKNAVAHVARPRDQANAAATTNA